MYISRTTMVDCELNWLVMISMQLLSILSHVTHVWKSSLSLYSRYLTQSELKFLTTLSTYVQSCVVYTRGRYIYVVQIGNHEDEANTVAGIIYLRCCVSACDSLRLHDRAASLVRFVQFNISWLPTHCHWYMPVTTRRSLWPWRLFWLVVSNTYHRSCTPSSAFISISTHLVRYFQYSAVCQLIWCIHLALILCINIISEVYHWYCPRLPSLIWLVKRYLMMLCGDMTRSTTISVERSELSYRWLNILSQTFYMIYLTFTCVSCIKW